jgi:hypothetical protein
MADMRPQGEQTLDLDGRPRHEDSDVTVGGIFKFALGLVALGMGIYVVLALVMQGFSRRESRAQALRPPFFAVDVVPPAPRLQGNPGVEPIRFKEQELEQLNHYGWINKEAGIARIPIDRAMDILAQKGLPEPAGPPEPETGKASPSGMKNAAPPDIDPRTEKKSRP